MMPYCGFFLTYLLYTFLIFEIRETVHTDKVEEEETHVLDQFYVAIDWMWLAVLMGFSLFFLKAEIRQVHIQRWSYLTSIWNYADFMPPLGILSIVIADVFGTQGTDRLNIYRISVQATVCFGMWIKIFYFLRIFRQTGFFVNMLLKVIKSSSVFFLLYVLIMCAFGCTFFIMAPSGEGFLYYLNYAYLLGLGEFDMEWDAYAVPAMMHLFFLIATLLVMIVMLNLLIAIVSTAYEEVIENQQEANDFERISLIADTAEFIKDEKKEDLCRRNEFLIKACIADGAGDEKLGD